MKTPNGFTNQQALLLLLICFPVGLIALGLVLVALQRQPKVAIDRPTPSVPEQPIEQPKTIEPLAPVKPEAPSTSSLSEQDARSIVEQWLTIKSQIFGPPFDTSLADQVVAEGPLWTDLTKDNGSIQWLKNNNSYYTYNAIRVNNVVRYLPSPEMPSIVVSVTESSVLNTPSGSKPSSSTNDWIYTLRNEGGRWKIWDYRKQ